MMIHLMEKIIELQERERELTNSIMTIVKRYENHNVSDSQMFHDVKELVAKVPCPTCGRVSE